VYLLFRRLAQEGPDARAVGQGVFDAFVADMDGSLREMGTGDLAVPRTMRAMGEAFYGRASAYDAALGAADDHALAAALSRNVYGDAGNEAALRLAGYVRQAAAALAAQDAGAMARGIVRFPSPET
jgi:cytochrome b pre-mRNA-processing protein 3